MSAVSSSPNYFVADKKTYALVFCSQCEVGPVVINVEKFHEVDIAVLQAVVLCEPCDKARRKKKRAT